MQQGEVQEVQEWVQREAAVIERLLSEVRKVIVGQRYLLDRMMIGLLADGHLLLEGVPGLAKTLAVQSMANAVQARFQRVQFTPDLLPADLTGTLIYNQRSGDFEPRKGLLTVRALSRALASVGFGRTKDTPPSSCPDCCHPSGNGRSTLPSV